MNLPLCGRCGTPVVIQTVCSTGVVVENGVATISVDLDFLTDLGYDDIRCQCDDEGGPELDDDAHEVISVLMHHLAANYAPELDASLPEAL
jgi:hypothetical protein